MVRTRNGRGAALDGVVEENNLRDEVRRSLDNAANRIGASNVNRNHDGTLSDSGEGDELMSLRLQVNNLDAAVTINQNATDAHDERMRRLEQLCQNLDAWKLDTANRLAEVEVSTQTNTNEIGILNDDLGITNTKVTNMEKSAKTLQDRVTKNSNAIDMLVTANENFQTTLQANVRDLTSMIIRRNTNIARDITPAVVRAELPTFGAAAYDRPMQFLSALNKYIEAIDPHKSNFKFIIDQALKGPAHDWWEHVESRVISFEIFRERFTTRYWNSSIQAAFSRELEFGFYRAENNLSRSEYVIRIYNNVKYLSDMPTMTNIVDKLSRHFDESVQQAIISRGINDIDGVISLLDSMDQIGSLNSTIAGTRVVDFHESSPQNRRLSDLPLRSNNSGGFRASTPRPQNSQEHSNFDNWRDNRPYRPPNARYNSNNSTVNTTQNSNNTHLLRTNRQVHEIEIENEDAQSEN